MESDKKKISAMLAEMDEIVANYLRLREEAAFEGDSEAWIIRHARWQTAAHIAEGMRLKYGGE